LAYKTGISGDILPKTAYLSTFPVNFMNNQLCSWTF